MRNTEKATISPNDEGHDSPPTNTGLIANSFIKIEAGPKKKKKKKSVAMNYFVNHPKQLTGPGLSIPSFLREKLSNPFLIMGREL